MSGSHDFLHRKISERLIDRLKDVNRPFERVLDIAGGLEGLDPGQIPAQRVTADLADARLRATGDLMPVAMDEEFLPFAKQSFGLVTSTLTLHWANDLPGALLQIRQALMPDGMFLAAMLGGDTLIELRRAFIEAEAETTGGTSPRTSPFAGVTDAGSLLQRAGFALPVVDTDTLTVTYDDMFGLMHDLRGMGETNSVTSRNRGFLRRDTLFAAADRYRDLFIDVNGRIPATFQIIWLAGWAPHVSQQHALRPGSGDMSLAKALEAKETSAGEKADPAG
ncbi:MAG: methyltransferase domain-containing protein [Pseudomonadota bacterium]|nr:methyltransferase domain-containing protein [Pseudomonadota bacterium]